MASTTALNVLGVDDSNDDLFFLERALSKRADLRLVATAADGEEAIAYLRGEGKFSDRTRWPAPDLMLLDLKMPERDGFAVLEWLRANPQTKLRVFVFTSSLSAADRSRALELGANEFYIKPTSPAGYREFAALISASVAAQTA